MKDGKKHISITLFIIMGMQSQSASCVKFNGNDEISIEIKALNDDIESIEVSEVFELPYELISDNEEFARFSKQLDASYHFEDNHLIRKYTIVLDDRYSFMNTLQKLEKEHYHCEQ